MYRNTESNSMHVLVERHRTYMYTCKYSPSQMGVSMVGHESCREREQVTQVSFNCLFTRGDSARGYSLTQFTWNQETLLCGPYTLSFLQTSAPNPVGHYHVL